MKKIFCLSILLLSLSGFSQNPVVLVLGKPSSSFASTTPTFSLKDVSFSLNISDKSSYAAKYWLTAYNPMTQMNDHYVKVGDQYYLSNLKSFSLNNFDGTRIDSFNPNGACDFGSGIASGLLNMLINKF